MALLSGLRKADAAPAAGGDVVKGSDSQNFMKEVIEGSRNQTVVVDFWAPWCGPCKQLGPIIERVVRAAGGKVRLVKINIDESPELAQQLRIQSIPMVYAFHPGRRAARSPRGGSRRRANCSGACRPSTPTTSRSTAPGRRSAWPRRRARCP